MVKLLVSLWLSVAAFFCLPFEPEGTQVFLVGDSTMADKPGSVEENPERGWGQLLPEFFVDNLRFYNMAVNGRSTKSFIEEGKWQAVMDRLDSGDVVFIQFGHNDQKSNDPNRYTNAWTSYRQNLGKMIRDCKTAGATPIILSSIVRRNFNMHGTLVDTHGNYPIAAEMVAQEYNVPFIDMLTLTEAQVAQMGPEASKNLYLFYEKGEHPKFPLGIEDNTHLSLMGARTYASLVVGEIQRLNILPLTYFIKTE